MTRVMRGFGIVSDRASARLQRAFLAPELSCGDRNNSLSSSAIPLRINHLRLTLNCHLSDRLDLEVGIQELAIKEGPREGHNSQKRPTTIG